MGQISGQDCSGRRYRSWTGELFCNLTVLNSYSFVRQYFKWQHWESQVPPVGIPAPEGSSNFFGLAGSAGGLALPPRWHSLVPLFVCLRCGLIWVCSNFLKFLPPRQYVIPWFIFGCYLFAYFVCLFLPCSPVFAAFCLFVIFVGKAKKITFCYCSLPPPVMGAHPAYPSQDPSRSTEFWFSFGLTLALFWFA